MRVDIRDKEALRAVSPAALTAYARAAGWRKLEGYGDHSDVYAAAEMPEIILPRTERLGDYASVVARLIDIFAKVAEKDELSLYRDLVTADHDVVRLRVAESDDGSLSVNSGVDLITGARDMLLAAACSLREPQPLYRAGANKEASDFLERVRLGQTEQGSFAVTLLTPTVPAPVSTRFPGSADFDEPIERRMTRRLIEALVAARQATESAVEDEGIGFVNAVDKGVSANLCEALVKLIGPFPVLDVSVTWAQTRPTETARKVVGFGKADAVILREAARMFRSREPQPDTVLYGIVQRLKRRETDTGRSISLSTSIDGRNQVVALVLRQFDYKIAVQAYRDRAPVMLKGDLERSGQRWRLLNPRIICVIRDQSIGERPVLRSTATRIRRFRQPEDVQERTPRIEYGKLRLSLKRLEEQYGNHEHVAPERSDLDREGIGESVIHRFEVCYDCLWKVLRRYLTEELGVAEISNSPKPVFRIAHENHLLASTVEHWLRYADARIDTSYDYDGEIALDYLALVRNFLDDAIGVYLTMSGATWE